MEFSPHHGQVVRAPHPGWTSIPEAKVFAVFRGTYLSGKGVEVAVLEYAGRPYEADMALVEPATARSGAFPPVHA
jgi:hypothetical protein